MLSAYACQDRGYMYTSKLQLPTTEGKRRLSESSKAPCEFEAGGNDVEHADQVVIVGS